MLKLKYDKQEDIPKEAVSFYEEKEEGGKKFWMLKVEGAIPAERLNEFRDNNRQLHTKISDLEKKFEGIDPESARALAETVGGLKNEEVAQLLKDAKKIDGIVETRTKTMREQGEAALAAVRADKDKIQRRLEEVEINQATVGEATKRGLKATAILDITYRARTIFKLNGDNKPVAYESDGKTVKFGKDGNPLTIAEWVESQQKDAPHLFEESKGQGSGGDGTGGSGDKGGKGKNPFKKGTADFNMTEQMKLMRSDPDKARRMMIEAGIKPPAVAA